MGKNVVSDEEDEVEFEDEEREPADGGKINRHDDDDDDEDEEGQDEYEKDDFIVDDVEEEEADEEEEKEDSDEERHRKKKKKKKREAEDVLDEDDYELLRDNNVYHHRPKDSKKFKRLKKAQRDSDEDRYGFSDDEFDESGKGGRTAEEKLKRSLFGDDEGVPLEDMPEEEEQEEVEEDADIGDEDEMADFIVDEDDEDGTLVRRKKLKKKKSRQASGASSSALQEAQEIFGDVDELIQMRKQGLESSEWRERRLEDEFEPTVLSVKYMTEKDDQIRMIDIPERMQVSEESTGPPPLDDFSILEESNWLYSQFASGTVPLFAKNGLLINKDDVTRFLELHHIQKLDIPFIAMYRKEECLSLLKDPDQHVDNENSDDTDKTPTFKWHKEVATSSETKERPQFILQ
uniref:Spt6 acidic N-terminal domain-containing protein n=1 Tax=Salix viminalis TaxID=40686 RepID=A0A6N2KU44_SALVM